MSRVRSIWTSCLAVPPAHRLALATLQRFALPCVTNDEDHDGRKGSLCKERKNALVHGVSSGQDRFDVNFVGGVDRQEYD